MKPRWALEFLKTGNMNMARLDQFADNLETITAGNVSRLSLIKILDEDFFLNSKKPLPEQKQIIQNVRNQLKLAQNEIKRIQKLHYAVCWHLSDRESFAMWDLYSREDGIAFKFERKALQKLIRDRIYFNTFPNHSKILIGGRVKYQDFEKMAVPLKTDLIKYLAFRKDISYEHEKEYRFVLALEKEEEYLERYDFNLGDLSGLDFDIISNPKMPKNLLVDLNQKIQKINSNFHIQKSELSKYFELMKLKL